MDTGTPSETGIDWIEKWSEPGTVGVEWEFGIVSRRTRQLVDGAGQWLIEKLRAADESTRRWLVDELFTHTIEVVSPPSRRVGDLTRFFAEKIELLSREIEPKGWRLFSAGAHPMARPRKYSITPSASRLRRLKRVPSTRDMMIWSVHVHYGVQSKEVAIAAIRELHAHLPFFIALSASSPYWEGEDKGVLSHRIGIQQINSDRREPPLFDTWDELSGAIQRRIDLKRLEDPKNLKWEIRPTPHGTVELRICDAPATLREMAAIVALGQCLVARAADFVERDMPLRTINEGDFRANRDAARQFGLGAFMATADGNNQRLRERIPDLVRDLMPYARQLGCVDEFEDLVQLSAEYTRDEARGSSASRQRAAVEQRLASTMGRRVTKFLGKNWALRAAVDQACGELDRSVDNEMRRHGPATSRNSAAVAEVT